MDSSLKEIYQQVILDHNKSPRNYKVLTGATNTAEGYNPLCGDHINIYAIVENNIVTDLSFQGNGCAISKSSASIMTTVLKGKTVQEAEALFNKFHDFIMGKLPADADISDLGKLAIFEGVKEFPVRIKCATLAWHTVHSALTGAGHVVSTETE